VTNFVRAKRSRAKRQWHTAPASGRSRCDWNVEVGSHIVHQTRKGRKNVMQMTRSNTLSSCDASTSDSLTFRATCTSRFDHDYTDMMLLSTSCVVGIVPELSGYSSSAGCASALGYPFPFLPHSTHISQSSSQALSLDHPRHCNALQTPHRRRLSTKLESRGP